MTELGNAISRLLKERGMSLRAAAAQAPVNPGYLSQVINDKRKGSAQLAAALDRVLGTGGELTAVWEASEGSQVARDLARTAAESFHGTDHAAQSSAEASARVLAAWQQGKPRVPVQVLTVGQAGPREIEQLEAAADMFRVWDHQHGGILGRRAATGQLADIGELLSEPHPEPLRRRLLSVAARMSIIVAHMSADAGLEGYAAIYLDLALAAARDAGNSDLGARAANAIARRILDAGRPQDAVTLLRHARASLRGIRPPEEALLYATEAWASARLGDRAATDACLDQSAGLADAAGSTGPAEVAGVAGACYETLAAASEGTARAQAAAQAGHRIAAALEQRDPYYVRSRVLDLAGLARVRLLQDEPDEAMSVATQALDAASGLRSRRTARRIHTLAISAIDLYPQASPVADFADSVRARLPL
jgi:transcriptional regulator with XRE-family HTH domain